jgi:hypothetical protein
MIRYDNFLSGIAQKTQELITHNKLYFQEKVGDFILRYIYWKEQLFEGQREALKNKKNLYIGKMPEFISKSDDFMEIDLFSEEDRWKQSIETKKPKGYILYNPYEIGFSNYWAFIIKGIEGYYWGKPLPINPVDTLRIRNDSTIASPPYETYLQKEHIERNPVDEVEDMTRKYFLLSVIHAKVGCFGVPIIDPGNEAAQLVWIMYRNMDGGKQSVWGKKIQNFITAAIKDVKVDLRRCQRQSTPAIKTNISVRKAISLQNRVNFTDTEENILEALGNGTMKAKALLAKAGYDESSHYRGILSGLVKRGVFIKQKGKSGGYKKS